MNLLDVIMNYKVWTYGRCELFNPCPAYCKHHTTETGLLNIHDHLTNAIGSQPVSCLCLLDLSAAFALTLLTMTS